MIDTEKIAAATHVFLIYFVTAAKSTYCYIKKMARENLNGCILTEFLHQRLGAARLTILRAHRAKK